MNWSLATDVILIASFAVLAVFAILGLCQWIHRKSLKKVDRELLWMPFPLALMAATYFIFDKIWILNTRPDGSGEASFPSTHAMVVATIFLLAALALPRYVKSIAARVTLYILMLALATLVAAGRILAGKHWASDVAAGLIFAAIFALIYYLTAIRSHKHAKHLHQNH